MNWSFSSLALTTNLMIFLGAGIIIGVCGYLLTERAERLARITGLGQALLGAVFLGVITSLSGTVTSVTAALEGVAEIAFGNAIGGIAVQTAFLVIADMVYRKANLEHAAASEENLLQGVLVVALLSLPMIGISGPGLTLWSVDLTSFLIVAGYLFGLRLIAQSHDMPMWKPRRTRHTAPRERKGASSRERAQLLKLWLSFGLFAVLVSISGWLLAHTGIAISHQSGLSETVVGTLFTSVTTSMPELVVAIAAVRRGALTLAVGNIMGGNAFDVLFLVLSDVAYRGGSLYQAVSRAQTFWLCLTILMTCILLMGLLRRQRHGFGNIGFEGVLVLGIYLSAVLGLFYL